jgi:hypothetical protein
LLGRHWWASAALLYLLYKGVHLQEDPKIKLTHFCPERRGQILHGLLKQVSFKMKPFSKKHCHLTAHRSDLQNQIKVTCFQEQSDLFQNAT